MANPQFYTRIQLKYDTWANWNTEAALAKVPLKGEVCLVEVPSGAATGAAQATPPSVLMKVGDGTKTFGQLPWLSALSADVHAWAKKSESEFLSWLDATGKFATDAELSAVDGKITALTNRVTPLETAKTNHETRIGDLEAALGTGGSAENSISKRVKALEDDMETVLGAASVAGSIAEAKKAGTDAAAAASTADGKALAAQNAVDAVELQLTGIAAGNGTVKAAIDAAAKKGEDAQKDVDAVEKVLSGYTAEGSVKSAIDGLDGRLDSAEGTIQDHTTQLGTVDSRISKAISDFATKVTSDNTTFDTFKELVDYVAEHQDVAEDMVGDLAIINKVLKSYVEAGTPVEDAVKLAIEAVDGKVGGLTTRVGTLEDHVTDASKLTKGTLSADRLATSGVTAGTYGAAQTATHGGSFNIPTVTVDNKGRVTSAGTVAITMPSVSSIEGNITNLQTAVQTLESDVTDASKLTKGTLPSARLENVVTAGSVGAASSPAHGGTFAIPKITYDAKGRITGTTTVNVTLPGVSDIEGEIDDLQERMNSAEGAIGASTDTASKTGTLYARVAKAQADAETGITNAGTAQSGVNTLNGLVGAKGDAATVDTAFGRIAKAQAAAEAAAGAASGAQNAVDAVELQLTGIAAGNGTVKAAIDAAKKAGTDAQNAVDAVELQLTGIAAGNGTVKAAIDAASSAASTADGKAVAAKSAADAAQGDATKALNALGTSLQGANAVPTAIAAAKKAGDDAQGSANTALAALAGYTDANAVKTKFESIDGSITSLDTKIDNLRIDEINSNTKANYVIFNCGSATELI